MGGEGVEEGVGGRVVGLAGAAQGAGGGGEQDERADVGGEFVEVPGRVGLGPQDGVEALGGEGAEDAVVDGAGGVDDCGEVLAVEESGEGVAVGDVAGGDADVGAESGQVGGEPVGAGGFGAPAGDEQEVAGAVPGDEVAGDEGAKAAGPAGDEDGAGDFPRRLLCRGARDPDESGNAQALGVGT
ncbi:hypothetical protein SAMN05428938_9103 [Streptomyces sp. KS_5]|nr:hypothetical protein SAMN05428938_9103 [Streptomyces sp. KS_5]